MINYILTRSSRKSTGIYVRDGTVEVRAPLKQPKQQIDQFVLSKEEWIQKIITKQKARMKQWDSFIVDYGSKILWLGKPYPIVSRNIAKVYFDGNIFYMPLNLTPEQIKAACIQKYRQLATMHFNLRTCYYSAQMGVEPSKIKVNSAKTRWGSCSSKKNINFSWRLAMADESLIDYVIVHELAHLTEMNHSPRFWAIVKSVLPDFIERKKELQAFQRRIAHENWG